MRETPTFHLHPPSSTKNHDSRLEMKSAFAPIRCGHLCVRDRMLSAVNHGSPIWELHRLQFDPFKFAVSLDRRQYVSSKNGFLHLGSMKEVSHKLLSRGPRGRVTSRSTRNNLPRHLTISVSCSTCLMVYSVRASTGLVQKSKVHRPYI
jgi:hypothetical protein